MPTLHHVLGHLLNEESFKVEALVRAADALSDSLFDMAEARGDVTNAHEGLRVVIEEIAARVTRLRDGLEDALRLLPADPSAALRSARPAEGGLH